MKKPATEKQLAIREYWHLLEEIDPDISTEMLFARIEERFKIDAADVAEALSRTVNKFSK